MISFIFGTLFRYLGVELLRQLASKYLSFGLVKTLLGKAWSILVKVVKG